MSLDGFGLRGVPAVKTWRIEGGAFRGWVMDRRGEALFEGPRCIQCGATVVLAGSGQPGDKYPQLIHGGVPKVHWCYVDSDLARELRSIIGLPRLPREPSYLSSPWGVPRYGSGWTPQGWVDRGDESAIPDDYASEEDASQDDEEVPA